MSFRKNRFIDVGYIAILLTLSVGIHCRFWNHEIIMGHDTRWHLLWVNYFSKQLTDGVLYPRWLADANHGYGSPTFVYYPPLPYYFAHLFKGIFNWSIPHTLAGVYSLVSFISGSVLYFYKRKEWGRFAAFTSSICFILTPYSLYTHYERMAFSSAFSTLWLPIGLWFTDLARQQPRYFYGMVLVSAGLALSNLPAFLLFSIFWGFYLVAAHYSQGWMSILKGLFAILLGWGISFFYLASILFERDLVKTTALINAQNFDVSKNLIQAKGFSDLYHSNAIATMWFLDVQTFLIIAIVAGVLLLKTRRKPQNLLALIGCFAVIAWSTHRFSGFIWESISVLRYAQFPWRLFPALSLFLALLLGYCVSLSRNQSRLFQVMIWGLILLCLAPRVYTGLGYVRDAGSVQNPHPWTPPEEASEVWVAAEKPFAMTLTDVMEYRPIAASPPRRYAPEVWFDGDAKIERWEAYERRVKVSHSVSAPLTFRLYCYPAWKLRVDESVWNEVECSEQGLVQVVLPAGVHTVTLRYKGTVISNVGVGISCMSLGLLSMIAVWHYRNYRTQR